MDLRVAKTKKRITTAFLKLRDKFTPDKIKVKDICHEAMINKTTFYKHYNDSIDLSNKITKDVIESVVASFPSKGKIFEDPKEYIRGILYALEVESDKLIVLFRGNQDALSARLADRLASVYYDENMTSDSEIRLSFAIGGLLRVVNDYIFSRKNYDTEILSECLTKMICSLPESASESV